MEIPDIRIRKLDIPDIRVFDINTPSGVSNSIPFAPPVTVNIGLPIVDLPGCVEANKESNPKNTSLLEDDERGTVTLCDSGVPSFNPIQFEPEQVIPTRPAPVPKTDTPKKPTPEIPTAPEVSLPKIPEVVVTTCPTREQELLNPIGKVLEGNKKIVGYELVGEKCIEVTEKLNIPEQIITSIPNAGMVTTTASIAVVATTSALMAKPLADILLKVVKPTVKKIIKKIAKLRGKTPKVLSTAERINEQRDRNRAIMTLRQTLRPK